MSIIAKNQTKARLQSGKPVLGTMLAEIRQPAIMQVLANAGFDFVIIDNEHGPFSIESVAELSRAAVYAGITPVVRVPDLLYPYLAQSLDVGAQAIMLPRIYNADQVKQALEIVKYPPVGARGCATSRGHTSFQPRSVVEFMAASNEEHLLVVQIETASSVEQVEEIVSMPGVDVAFVGPNDLSISLGVPGQMDSPVLDAAIQKVIDACQRHNVAAAIQTNAPETAAGWVERGMNMVSISSELGLLTSAGLAATSNARGASNS